MARAEPLRIGKDFFLCDCIRSKGAVPYLYRPPEYAAESSSRRGQRPC